MWGEWLLLAIGAVLRHVVPIAINLADRLALGYRSLLRDLMFPSSEGDSPHLPPFRLQNSFDAKAGHLPRGLTWRQSRLEAALARASACPLGDEGADWIATMTRTRSSPWLIQMLARRPDLRQFRRS